VRSIELEVRTQAGLHARPAAAFVRAAAGFRSTIRLENVTLGRPAVDARSVVGVLSAGVEMGHTVRIVADGADEKRAVEVLGKLLAGLDQAVGAQMASDRVVGRPGAPGIALGPPWWYRPGGVAGDAGVAGAAAAPAEAPGVAVSVASGAEAESLIRGAAETAAAQLNALAARLCEADRPGDAEILEAQALMAVDPAIIDEAVRLARGGVAPAVAVIDAAEESAALLAALPDALLAARAADVRDVAARIVRGLSGTHLNLPDAPSIVIADDLPPSLLAEMPRGLLLGVALAGGSPTAHVAILARSLGVPAVVTARGLLDVVRGAAMVALDGETGEIIADPDPAERQVLADRQVTRAARARAAAALRGRPAATSDGKRIALLANIRSPDEAARALEAGAEGVGLFRTEYLFLRRQSAPGEEEQVAAYRRVMEAFGPDRPVVIRLADIGGDKSIPYLGRPEEPNPFLGVRAIRLAGDSRDLLLTQLRAIWRAAGLAGVTPHVMAAMVATVADARLLLDMRDEARAQVCAAGAPCPERMVTGLMIEVPSAAIMAPELARMVDFFSIGTNDLTQYVLAADRGNPSLARFQDALHPAVLRTVAAVIAGARVAGIPVAVCGELAGDPAGALVLVGLGVDELSADAGSLDGVRAALAGVTAAELGVLAAGSLAATDAETVRARAKELLKTRG
jgi:phosphoenolpyruvate-protein phosphotransferase